MKFFSFRRAAILLVAFSLLGALLIGSVAGVHAQSSQTWSEPVDLSNSGSASNPLIVVDTLGVIHVVWIDQFDGYKYIESTDGVTWTEPKTVRFPFSPENPSQPVFLAGADGTTHIFWIDQNNALYYSQAPSKTFDDPGTWHGTVQLSDSAVDFKAAVDGEGVVHFAYVRNRGTDANVAGVYYRRLGAFGWSTVVNLYSSQYFRSLSALDAHVRVAVSDSAEGQHTVYVVWDDRSQKRILMSTSMDSGDTWSDVNEVVVPDAQSGYQMPANAEITASDTNVLLLWQVGEPGVRCNIYTKWSKDGGADWDTSDSHG